MKKIVFFTETEWAFGIIHYELTKYLFTHNITANVLNWGKQYTPEEIAELAASIDYFVSTPYGIGTLIDRYHVAPEKCIVVLHATMDLEQLTWFSHDNFMRLHNYGVVSPWLREKSIARGMPKEPKVVPLGINYNTFYSKPNDELNCISYAGAINPDNIHKNIKRPWLIQKVAERANMYLRIAHSYHNSWVTMPGFYKSVDCVIIASTEEGAGLPALEASAAGKLVISTPVGLWRDLSNGTGHTVPIDEELFVEETLTLVNYYRENSQDFKEKCQAAQEHARSYDWTNVIEHWVELLE